MEVIRNSNGTYSFVMPYSQVEVAVTFAEEPLPFADVDEGDWYYKAVAWAWRNGLMDGVAEGRFDPEGGTSRAMVVTILWRLEGEPVVDGAPPFTDVAEGEWYAQAVRWAAGAGIVNGTGDTTYSPNDPVTREQFAAILYRYAAYKGYDVTGRADLSAFTDAGAVAGWAADAMEWSVAAGLINGVDDGILAPQDGAIRAQAAAMLMRFAKLVAT